MTIRPLLTGPEAFTIFDNISLSRPGAPMTFFRTYRNQSVTETEGLGGILELKHSFFIAFAELLKFRSARKLFAVCLKQVW